MLIRLERRVDELRQYQKEPVKDKEYNKLKNTLEDAEEWISNLQERVGESTQKLKSRKKKE